MKNVTNLDIKRQNLGLNDDLNPYQILSLYSKSNTRKKIEIVSISEVLKFNERKYSDSLKLIFKLEKVNSVDELIKKISKNQIDSKIIENKERRKHTEKGPKKNKKQEVSDSEKFFESFAKNKFYIFSGIVVFIIILSIATPDKTTTIQSDDKFIKTNNIIKNKGSIQKIEGIPKVLKERFKIVWEIPMKHILEMCADRGAYICQSQSTNLWMETPSYDKLTAMHFFAWSKGLKTGIYYLRTKAKAAPQQFTIEPEKKNQVEEEEEECLMCGS